MGSIRLHAKTRLILVFLTFSSSIAFASNEFLKVEKVTSKQIVFKFTLPPFKIEKTKIDGQVLNFITSPLSNPADKQSSHMPTFGAAFRTFGNTNFKVTVSDVNSEDINNIKLPLDSKQQSKINSSAPSQIVRLTDFRIIRGKNFGRLEISPFQYDRLLSTLHIHKNLTIIIESEETQPIHAKNKILLDFKTLKIKDSEKPTKTRSDTEWLNPNSDYFKITVQEDGIYRIGYNEFIDSGIAIDYFDPSKLALFNKGKEIPIWIEGPITTNFTFQNSILFYGERYRNKDENFNFYTDANIYWLTEVPESGKRFSLQEQPTEGEEFAHFFWDTLHFEEDNIFHQFNLSTPLDEGETWIWRYLFESQEEVVTFTIPSLNNEQGVAHAQMRLQGTTRDIASPDHHITFSINNQIIDEEFWDDKNELLLSSEFPLSVLKNGQNSVKIRLESDTGAQVNQIYLDWIKVIYPSNFVALNNKLKFGLPSNSSGITKFNILNLKDSSNTVLETSSTKIWQPTSKKRSFYSVESAGFDDGKFVSFNIDFKTHFTRDRGHNLATIDTTTGNAQFHHFDTFASENDANEMAELIQSLPDGTLVLAGISDEGSASMTENAYAAFESLGSIKIREVAGRDSWAFIGYKSISSFAAKETLLKRFEGPAIASDTTTQFFNFNYAIEFSDSVKRNNKYIIADEKAIKKVDRLEIDRKSSLREITEADYIIISHRLFWESANQLANYRESVNGYKSIVVDIEDIYDEFNFGILHPNAIKDFLKHTYSNWTKAPLYVLLFGDASWDPTNNLSDSVKENFIPSYGVLVSDNWFVTLDGQNDILPDMFIGRLPVETVEQAQLAVNKILQYESTPFGKWDKKFLLFNGGENEFEQRIFALQGATLSADFITAKPFGGISQSFNKTTNEIITQDFRRAAADEIQNGSTWVNFIGHAGSSVWDIDIGSPSEWNNLGLFPIITGMSCHSARFANPNQNSLSEEYVLDTKGAAAYWGSSGFGYINQDYFLLQGLLSSVLKDTVRSLGEAVTFAKIHLWETLGDSERSKSVIDQYILIGDPALQINIPDKPELSIETQDIKPQSDFILTTDSTTNISATINNFGLIPSDSIDFIFKQSNLTTVNSFKVPPFSNTDSLELIWNVPNEAGSYILEFNIDPDSKIPEKNKLNNIVQTELNVLSSDLLPISPINFGVVNESPFELITNNSKLNDPDLKYFFEIDTVSSFTSPFLKKSNGIDQGRLVTKYEQNLNFESTYFWRVRSLNMDNYGQWIQSSFSYGSNNSNWAQQGELLLENNSGFNFSKLNGSSIGLIQKEYIYQAESAGALDGNYSILELDRAILGPNHRGHNIAILDGSNGQVIALHEFDTYKNSQEADSMANIISGLQAGLIVIGAIRDDGFNSITESAHQALESIGSQYTRQVGFRDSWAIIGRKGAAIGTVPEVWSRAGEGPAVVVDTLNRHVKTGTMTSTEIGPALAWQSANFEFISENTTESIAFDIIARNSSSGRIDTLIRDSRDTDVSLAGIDAKLYPKIQLQATLQSEDGLSTPLLKSWSVDYEPPPDLVVGNESILLNKDTVQTAEQLNLAIDSGNFGLSASDSFTIRISMAEKGQAPQQAQLMRVPGIPVDKFASYETVLSTENLRGRVTLNIEMDALNEIPEINESNNLTSSEFWVVDDTLSPDIRLTFDGREITHDEFVALSPRIMIEINDSGAVQFTDTSQVTIFLDNDKIPFGVGSGQAEFIPNSNPGENELKATVLFTPTLTDGDHVLEIIAKDVSDNSKYISNNFIVSEDFSLTNVMNYPNPFSRTTEFTYIITQPADGVKIKVFTVAGRLIMILDNLPTRVGFNQFLWDGRDRDGDRIANGVYLYKIIARQSSRQAEVIEKLVIMR